MDGYLIYVMTLNWELGLGGLVPQMGKPLIVADEFLGGCGSFLTGVSALRKSNIPLAAVSSTRLEDLVVATRVFAEVKQPDSTPATFARRCEEAYRKTFPRAGEPEKQRGQSDAGRDQRMPQAVEGHPRSWSWAPGSRGPRRSS